MTVSVSSLFFVIHTVHILTFTIKQKNSLVCTQLSKSAVIAYIQDEIPFQSRQLQRMYGYILQTKCKWLKVCS